MLDAGDAMRLAISKKTACPKGFSKTMEEGLPEILVVIIIIEEEAVAEIRDIRDNASQTSANRKEEKSTMPISQTQEM